jgi:hypothetical protein
MGLSDVAAGALVVAVVAVVADSGRHYPRTMVEHARNQDVIFTFEAGTGR